MKDVVVLGAGMVGVSVAWHLARRGHAVTLVDRRAPGCETSFGNAGLIQREAVRPRPFPRDVATLWRLLPNHGIDVRYRGSAVLGASRALAGYWHNSAPGAFARIVPEYASLIRHCTQEHGVMIEDAGADALVRKDGWHYGFRSQKEFDHQLELAEEARDLFGAEYKMLDQAQLHQCEPALSDRLVGAIEWTNSWSVVDPGALVQAYADAFVALGGRVVQAEASELVQVGRTWQLKTAHGAFSGSDVVLAAGPWSSEWLARLGYRLPMFYMRGYHMHYGAREGQVLNKPVLDYEKGYLLSPKRAGIRLTTGAELNSLHAPPRPGQLDAAEEEARQVFPLGERLEPEAWLGSRPCMADMKPVIGPAPRHDGLWFALGHAHQGFTSGPLTGRLIGEMMDGEPPLVDMAPFRADRF